MKECSAERKLTRPERVVDIKGDVQKELKGSSDRGV